MAVQDDQTSGNTIALIAGAPSTALVLTTLQQGMTLMLTIPDKVRVMALGRVGGSGDVPDSGSPGTPRRWGPFVWEIVPLGSEYVFESIGADVEIEVAFVTGYRANLGKIQ